MFFDQINEISKVGNLWFSEAIRQDLDVGRDATNERNRPCVNAACHWFADYNKALSCAFVEEF